MSSRTIRRRFWGYASYRYLTDTEVRGFTMLIEWLLREMESGGFHDDVDESMWSVMLHDFALAYRNIGDYWANRPAMELFYRLKRVVDKGGRDKLYGGFDIGVLYGLLGVLYRGFGKYNRERHFLNIGRYRSKRNPLLPLGGRRTNRLAYRFIVSRTRPLRHSSLGTSVIPYSIYSVRPVSKDRFQE